MLTTVLVGGFLLVATVTDWRERRIYNWTTYPGILVALGINAVGSIAAGWDILSPSERAHWLGTVGIADSLWGLAACGGLMIVCYVFFPGGVGGGDIKLIAMIGAFWGLARGIEVMLWTFVIGGAAALIVLVWRIGAVNIVVKTFRFVSLAVRTRGSARLTKEEREPLATQLFLAPSAMAAVLIVYFGISDWLAWA